MWVRIKERFKGMFSLNESPHRLAASFAVGIFIGICPLLGIHTLLALAVVYAFRLNMMVTMTGVYVTNPWTIIPIYTFTTWTGAKMLGMNLMDQAFSLSHLRWNSFLKEFKHLLKPFVVGSTTIGLLAAVFLYFIMYLIFKKVQAKKIQSAR